MVFAPTENAPQQTTSWWQSLKTNISSWWNRKPEQTYWQMEAAKRNQQLARQRTRAETVESFSTQPFAHPMQKVVRQRREAQVEAGLPLPTETKVANVALMVPLGIENAAHALLAFMFQKPSENDQAIEKEIYDWLVRYVVDSDDYYPTFSSKLHALLKETDFFAFLEASEGNRWRLFQGQRNKVIAKLRENRDRWTHNQENIGEMEKLRSLIAVNRAERERVNAEGITSSQQVAKGARLDKEFNDLVAQLKWFKDTEEEREKAQETPYIKMVDRYLQEYRKLFRTTFRATISETLAAQLQQLNKIQPSNQMENYAYNAARKSLENVIGLQLDVYGKLDEKQKAKVDAAWRQTNEYAAEEAEASAKAMQRSNPSTGEKRQRLQKAQEKIKERAETIEQEKIREEEARKNKWFTLGG